MTFGEYIYNIRKNADISMRKAAQGIGVSAQYYSTVEKSDRCAFAVDKLDSLVKFFNLTTEETARLYDLAATAHARKTFVVPQDIARYIMERPYVIEALRKLKKMNADEQDWAYMLERLRVRKGLPTL